MADEINDNEESEAPEAAQQMKTEHDDSSHENVGLLETRTIANGANGRCSLTEAKLDKAVSTNDTLLDLQRAWTYEAVFSTLIENKKLAMRREYEERKRAKCIKRRLMGRIFLTKKLFGAGRTPRVGSGGGDASSLTAGDDASEQVQQVHCTVADVAKSKIGSTQSLRRDEMLDVGATTTATATATTSTTVAATTTVSAVSARMISTSMTQTMSGMPDTPVNAEDSLTSTLSNSSEKHIDAKRNLLVHAQTHTPAELTSTSSTSASGDSKPDAWARHCPITNGSGQLPVASEQVYDISSLASGYENGAITTTITRGGAVHSSTMADDSLTSLRGSIESLSFASSRCTVSFGGTEVIPEDIESLQYERDGGRAIKRLRMLEAKSISAQCSPIFPRHVIRPTLPEESQLAHSGTSYHKTIPSNYTQTPAAHTEPTATLPSKKPLRTSADCIDARSTKRQTTKIHAPSHFAKPLGQIVRSNYISDSLDVSAHARYARNFSRQNTSEDSANLTVSTLLNQSDSFSLNAPPSYANASSAMDNHGSLVLNDRYKSKSTSLLLNGRVRQQPEPPQFTIIPIEEHGPRPELNVNTTHKLSYNDRSLVVDSNNKIKNVPSQALKPDPMAIYPNKQAASDTIVNITDVSKVEAMMQRIATTTTGSSMASSRGCTTVKPNLHSGQSVSDEEYKRHKRKYKRYHRCSDPILVTTAAGAFQPCQLDMIQNENIIDYPHDWPYDMDEIKIEDLDEIAQSGHRHHRKHRHRRHKKRRRHKKPKIIVQDLETQVVKVIDPHDLSQRARWTIIATACLLLLMCLMLVGITLRMAPIIDDIVRQENERILKESLDRSRIGKNFTETASLAALQQQHQPHQPHMQQQYQQQIP